MAVPKDPSDRSTLWLALRDLAHDTGIQRDDLLEALAGDLRELRRCWGINLSQTTDPDLVRTTICDLLEIYLTNLVPLDKGSRRKYLHAIRVSFNMLTDPDHAQLKDRNISARRSWLVDRAPVHLRVSHSTSGRYLEHAIDHVEEQILASGYVPAPPSVPQTDMSALIKTSEDSPVLSAVSDGYVTRETLERQLRAAVTGFGTNGGHILLYGEGGMGKSRLARDFVKHSDHIVINFGDNREITDVILDVFETRPGADSTIGSPVRRLRKLIADGQGPQYLILDDVDSEAQWNWLLPEQFSHTIVISTSRRNILPPDCGIAIKVKSMQPIEAHSLLLSQHPSLTYEELRWLNVALAGHALALKQAAAYLRKYPMVSVDEFCRALQRHTTAILANLPVESSDAALLAIYTQVIESLAGRPSLQVLRGMAFSWRVSLKRFLEAFVQARSPLGDEYPHLAGAQALKGLEELTDLCLIDCHREYVFMHPLTHSILRDLMLPEAEAILNDTIQVLVEVKKDTLRWGHELRRSMGDEEYWRDWETNLIDKGAVALSEAAGYRLIRFMIILLTITKQEASRLRAVTFPTEQYREAFRQELQLMCYCCYGNRDTAAFPSLQQYIDWFHVWMKEHQTPSSFGPEHEYFRVASQAAIDRFIPLVSSPVSELPAESPQA